MFRPLLRYYTYGCLFLIIAFAACKAEPGTTLSEAQKRGGWQLIFDGKTTQGWRNFKEKELRDGWKVQGEALVRADAGAGSIVTESQYQYFELSLEYKISAGGNSGIMFHVTEEYDTPWKTGPEIQVQDNVAGHDPQKS